MKRMLPCGEAVPALGQGTWNIGDDPALRQQEIAGPAIAAVTISAWRAGGTAIVRASIAGSSAIARQSPSFD